MKSARSFSIVTLSVALGVLGAIALLNYWVDPYNQYGNNRLGVYVTSDRESKATDVKRFKHNAILLGNSREGMIPPRKLDGFTFFNGAFGGGTAEEVYYFIQHFVFDQKVVVLGIDYGQCDPPVLKGDIFAPMQPKAVLNQLLNLKTVEDSFRTITYRVAGKAPALEADGTFNADGWFEKYDREIAGSAELQIGSLKEGASSMTRGATGSLNFYRAISKLLASRKIPCVIYIPPLPLPVSQHVRSLSPELFERAWLGELQTLFPNIVNLSHSHYGDLENFFRSDLQHLKPDSSANILNAEIVPLCVVLARQNHLD